MDGRNPLHFLAPRTPNELAVAVWANVIHFRGAGFAESAFEAANVDAAIRFQRGTTFFAL